MPPHPRVAAGGPRYRRAGDLAAQRATAGGACRTASHTAGAGWSNQISSPNRHRHHRCSTTPSTSRSTQRSSNSPSGSATRRSTTRGPAALLLGIAITSCFCSHLADRRGSIPDAETDAWAGLKAAEIGGYAVAPMALALLIDALLEQGELAAATRTLQQHAFEEALPDNFNLLLFSRGRLRIAAAQTESGVADVRELGRREQHSRAPPRSRSSAPTSASSGTSPRASRTTASLRSTSSPLGSRASRSTSTSSPAA
jgi:hypothetical protein